MAIPVLNPKLLSLLTTLVSRETPMGAYEALHDARIRVFCFFDADWTARDVLDEYGPCTAYTADVSDGNEDATFLFLEEEDEIEYALQLAINDEEAA